LVTREEIDAARTPKGSWTKARLAQWGVPWPPPGGWRDRLIRDGHWTQEGERRPRGAVETGVNSRITNRERKYNVPPGDFLRRLEVQRFRCADCRNPFDSFFVAKYDHDHQCCPGPKSCGRCVRGLVCNDCNWLRHVADSAGRNYVVLERLATVVETLGPDVLRRAAENLRACHPGEVR
jgi:hypothetical protein